MTTPATVPAFAVLYHSAIYNEFDGRCGTANGILCRFTTRAEAEAYADAESWEDCQLEVVMMPETKAERATRIEAAREAWYAEQEEEGERMRCMSPAELCAHMGV